MEVDTWGLEKPAAMKKKAFHESITLSSYDPLDDATGQVRAALIKLLTQLDSA